MLTEQAKRAKSGQNVSIVSIMSFHVTDFNKITYLFNFLTLNEFRKDAVKLIR